VSGGVEGNPDAVQVGVFAIGNGLDGCLVAESEAQDLKTVYCGKIPPALPPRMIPVGMGDNGAVHGLQRVDVKIPCLTVKALFSYPEDFGIHV